MPPEKSLAAQYWKYFLAVFIAVDLFIVAGFLYLLVSADTQAMTEEEIAAIIGTPTPTPTITSTPWGGPPGGIKTPTPLLPPTPLSTQVLAQSGFPPGFTPTPMPTPTPFYITLPSLYPGRGIGAIDAPVINQVLYPEPFFPPGTNNACGPVSIYAAFLGMGIEVDYRRISNIAVGYGFNAEGITISGIVNTISVLNQEVGSPITMEYGRKYNTSALIKQLRKGGIIMVLLRVRKVNGQFQLTADTTHSFGHFLLVERINTRTKKVHFAGSTLGMSQVSLDEFVSAWTRNPQYPSASPGFKNWQSFMKQEPANNWALIIKRAK